MKFIPGPHEPAAPCPSEERPTKNSSLACWLKRNGRGARQKGKCTCIIYYPQGCTQECIIHFSLICMQTKRSFSTIFAWAIRHLKNFSATLGKTSQGLQQSWENVFHQTRNWPSLSMIGWPVSGVNGNWWRSVKASIQYHALQWVADTTSVRH